MIHPLRILVAAAALALPVSAHAAVEIQEVTSPGGIEAWLVEESSIPFVALEIRFDGGAVLDPDDAVGATNLMVALLEEGAAERDAQAFAEAVEGLAARFGFDAYHDGVNVSAAFLTENRDEGVALLRDALTRPRFDPDAIERVREQVLAVIEQDNNDPSAIAGRKASELAYPDHPYGRPVDGTTESVAGLTRDDLVDAHARTLVRSRMHVGATGDITAEELGLVLDELLGGLPEGEAVDIPMADYALDGGVTVTEFPTPQSVVIFGHDSIMQDDPDFFPAFVMNHVLGGRGFDSRLMTEVREERGLTYGIGSYLSPRDYGASHLGQFSSGNDRVAEAIAVVRDQWADIAENGITQEELDRAKTFLTGAYPLRFDGNGTIAGILVGMQSQGWPTTYIETRNDRVNAVTLDDVQRVARRIMRPEDLHFLVVGQPEGVESGTLPEG
ncbi:pitrilysin family protein [Jannaschia sp. LMIT008]|uniref:M16 family metallopeptidase n=1 Tax=Jannaschia maritima TaxID=3032585 RepID=UPI002810BDA3|nr:pitrilysin family protein [Jannaschia sp. LMIT008]